MWKALQQIKNLAHRLKDILHQSIDTGNTYHSRTDVTELENMLVSLRECENQAEWPTV